MSGPTRQRSFRERLHGIGIPWQGKKSKSYYSKEGQALAETEEKKPSFMDSRSCDPILPCDDKKPPSAEGDRTNAVGEVEDLKSTPPSTPPILRDDSCQAKPGEKSAEQYHKDDASKIAEKKMLSRSFTQPKGTEEYQVKASDTLSSIAARFHTTPSELAKLNRLTTRMIFPGQLLFVPERRSSVSSGEPDLSADGQDSGGVSDTSGKERNDCYKSDRIGNKLDVEGDGDPSSLPKRKVSVTDALRIPYRRHSDRMQRFLKVKARHFTDGQGVVSGVLIVTPNAVMFDPNVSDPLVIEHGIESYGVIAPLNMVMRAAIYFDIAHMKVKNAPETTINIPKPDIYYGKMNDDSAVSDICANKPNAKITNNNRISETAEAKSGNDDEVRIQETPSGSADDTRKPAEDDVPEQKEESQAVDEQAKEETTPEKPKGSEEETKDYDEPKMRESFSRDGSLDKEVSDAFADGVKKPPVSENSSSVGSPTPPPRAGSAGLQQKTETPTEKQAPESKKEKMLKRLSYPMESITSYTHSSISRLLSSSPKSFVDFSGGLFVKNAEEEKNKEDNGSSSAAQQGKDTKSSSVGSEQSIEELDETPKKEPNGSVDKREENAAVKPPADPEKTNTGDKVGPQPVETGYYKNFSDEEKPDVFAVLDRLLSQHAGREQEGPPLYLCLRMGHPKIKKLPSTTPILSYGKKRAKSEYWFGIPHNRVEDTYNFLQQWFPHLYGDVDDVDPEKTGFDPIDDDAEDEEEEEEQPEAEDQEKAESDNQNGSTHLSFLKLVEDHFGIRSISPTDWEVLSMSDSEKLSFVDFELPLPELLSTSEIFQEEHVKELYTLLPARAIGYPWTLIFSTSLHGFNLKTLYRKMSTYDTPVLLAIADIEGCVFGSLISSPLRQSDHFYGNGESFLYSFYPEFKVFKWTGENMYFVKGDPDSIAIGAGDGQFGIWIDGDLNHGRSQKCLTFDNEILCKTGDFVVKALEVWGFV